MALYGCIQGIFDPIVIISEQDKGLHDVVFNLLLNVEHGVCMRHF